MKENCVCSVRFPAENEDPLRPNSQGQLLLSLTKLQVVHDTMHVSEMRSCYLSKETETLELVNVFLMYFQQNAI